MWINPHTGKGWTDEEETLFAEIQSVSRLNRTQAIQLCRRMRNPEKALRVAKRDYPKPSPAVLASLAKARIAKRTA